VNLAHYLGLLHRAELELAAAYRQVGAAHAAEVDVFHITGTLAGQCEQHAERLDEFVERYGEADDEPERLHADLFTGTRTGGLGLLRDLHDLYLMAAQCDMAWTLIGQAAQGARDQALLAVVTECESEAQTQMRWLRTRMKQAAPQVLVVT
jgi:hypothetical protein